MYSVINATENFQQFRFVHPYICVVAGMIGSRNAVRVKSLLHQAQEVIHSLVPFVIAARLRGIDGDGIKHGICKGFSF